MLLTIERVALLKSIDIFGDTPDYVLASVARIVEEVELLPGEVFIHEGEPGNCMYVVIQGEVRAYRGEETIISLGPGMTVGELAILDPAPRAASVSALDDVFLFRIDKEPFDEVMADRPEIARAIVRTLTRRVREQGRTITDSAGKNQ